MVEIRPSLSAPLCIVLAVDRSGSMGRQIKGSPRTTLGDAATKLVNSIIMELILLSMRSLGEVRHYFDIGIFGYGFMPAAGTVSVASLLPRELGELGICDLPALADSPARVEKYEKDRWPVWVDTAHEGRTPMCQALSLIGSQLVGWVGDHSLSPPPVIVNITDGLVTDSPYEGASLEAWVDRLSSIKTATGVAKIFDLFLSPEVDNPVLRPATIDCLTLPGWTVTQVASILPDVSISTWPSLSTMEPEKGPGTPTFTHQAELADDQVHLVITNERHK